MNSAALSLVAAQALAFAAFAVVAVSMDRHQVDLLSAGHAALMPRAALGWRAGGFALLALSLWPCLLRWSPTIAVTAWLGLLSFGGLALAALLSYWPRAVSWLAPAAAALGLAAWALGAAAG